MERLTTDNPRNNTEVALNLVYAKDGQAWVRNGGPCPGYPDVMLYDYMRLIIADHGPMSIKTGLTDDELGDALSDALFDGIETKEGLCAMLYTLAWAFAELRQRLAAYEDTGLTPEGMEAVKTSLMGKSLAEIKEINGLPVERMIELAEAEHDGRLVVQPCAPGAEVWVVERDEYGCAVDVSGYMFLAKAGDAVILTAYINDLKNVQDTLGYHMQETAENYDTDLAVFPAGDCYTTREEAEKAMEGMEV